MKDELCRQLDEHGVKYHFNQVENGTLFYISCDDDTYYYVLVRDGHAGMEAWSQYLTPVKVIDMVLGHGTCKECKHAHMTVDDKYCKWCSVMATHDIDNEGSVDPPNGYDPEPYFEADFFCAFFQRKKVDA